MSERSMTGREDPMRRQYRALSDGEKSILDNLKREAEELWHRIDREIPECREKSLAKTKLEESIMWATKAIT